MLDVISSEEYAEIMAKNKEKLAKLIFEYQQDQPIVIPNYVDIKRLADWLVEHGVWTR